MMEVIGNRKSDVATKRKSSDAPEQGQITLFGHTGLPVVASDQFRKGVELVHAIARAKLSLTQVKMTNALLQRVVSTPPDSEGWWKVRNTELLAAIGWTESNNLEHIRESAQKMMGIRYDWDVLSVKQEAKGKKKELQYKSSVLITSVELYPDALRFQLSQEMMDKVIRPAVYALPDMTIIRQFRRMPSVQLYDLCGRFERLPQTPQMDWELVRDMLLTAGKTDSPYKEFKYFNSKVLGPSIKEVNMHAPFDITLKLIKEGRTVKQLYFEIRKKPCAAPPMFEGLEENMPLVGALVKEGILQTEALKMIKQHGASYVRSNLDYSHMRRSKIKNFAAYVRKAIIENYAVIDSGAKQSKPAGPSLDDLYRAHQIEEASRYFAEVSTEEQSSLLSNYNVQQATKPLQIGKKPSKAALTAFYAWLALITWGSPSPEDLLKFATGLLAKR